MTRPSIIYGVQGTGNGHINRARLMAAEFAKLDINVHYLFSGRAQCRYFDMEEFANRHFVTGLSFVTREGKIHKLKTLQSTRPWRFANEVCELHTERHDLAISDFEPTVAWAAQLRKTPCLAIGHQYALTESAPRPQGQLFAKWLVRHFAPAQRRIGFHWHPYGKLTLPPMIDTQLEPINNTQSFTLVYLPFEDQQATLTRLQQLHSEHFVMYSPEVTSETQSRNVSIYPLSKDGFQHHLQRCQRVVCNTGFELIAEALHLGKPILTKPLGGQFEQLANVMALKELKLATVTSHLDMVNLERFVGSTPTPVRRIYPNVAAELAAFCLQRAQEGLDDEQIEETIQSLASRLWSQVNAHAQPYLPANDKEFATTRLTSCLIKATN